MKKKRVRYLAAATAGLMPAATGLVFPIAAQAAGCTGHVSFSIREVKAGNDRVKGHGWFTREANGKICLGTVVVSTYTSTTGYDWPALSIASSVGRRGPFTLYYSARQVYAKAGTWGHYSFPAHVSGKISVCLYAWSKYYSPNGVSARSCFN